MKKITKSILVLCFSFLCLFMLPVIAQAASAPAKVKNVQAKAAESQVTLTWQKSSDAKGYNIYQVDDSTGENVLIKSITKAGTVTYKVENLKNNKKYTFRVSAYSVSGTKRLNGPLSTPVVAKPMLDKPAKPKLEIDSCGEESVRLMWNKVAKATAYEVYQKNPATGKFEMLGITKNQKVKVAGLKNGKEYVFKIRAFRQKGNLFRYGSFSSEVSGKPISISKAVKSIRTMGYKCRLLASFAASKVSGSGKVNLTAGNTIDIIERKVGNSIAELSDGTRVYVPNGYLSWITEIYSSATDMTKETAEAYVNAKGYSSETGVLMWINLYKQRLYMFKGSRCNWKMFRNYQISSGKLPASTPKGIYKIRRKAPTFIFDQDCFGYWATFFSGNAIHSWVYTGSPSNPGFKFLDGRIGAPASHGCVRVWTIQEAKQIFDATPYNTTCVIY